MRDRLLDLGRGRPDVAEEDVVAVLVLAERLRRAGRGPSGRRARTRRRAAARRGSSPSPRGGSAPRSSGCRRGRSRRRGRPSRPPPRSPPAAGPSCRCRSCSRSRPCGSRAARGTGVRPALVVVLGHDLRARARGSVFTHGLLLQAALDRLLREQAGADHHLRVRRVRAGRDRGDDDAAVLELVVRARDGDALAAGPDDRDRRRVGLGLRGAARGLLGGRVARRERVRDRLVVASVRQAGSSTPNVPSASRKDVFACVSGTRSCGRRGPASERLDGREVELDDLRVGRRRRPGRARAGSPCSTPRRARSARGLRPVSRR